MKPPECELARETLRSFADVLRVGCLVVNGRKVFWESSGAGTDQQLQSYCLALEGALKATPQLRNVDEAVLRQAPHHICKALSINYAMSEVLRLLEQKVNNPRGSMCSIRTSCDEGKSLVDYSIDFCPGNMVRARLSWRGCGNIISCDMKTSARKVRGTLFHVDTEFPLDLDSAFTPTYRLHYQLASSVASRVVNTVTNSLRGTHRVAAEETVCPSTPLAFQSVGLCVGRPAARKVSLKVSPQLQQLLSEQEKGCDEAGSESSCSDSELEMPGCVLFAYRTRPAKPAVSSAANRRRWRKSPWPRMLACGSGVAK